MRNKGDNRLIIRKIKAAYFRPTGSIVYKTTHSRDHRGNIIHEITH